MRVPRFLAGCFICGEFIAYRGLVTICILFTPEFLFVSAQSDCVLASQSEEVVNGFPAPPPETHTHTHGEMCVCAERERERVRERRGNQRAERKKVSQPAASEENGDHAGWMPPLVDAANALNFFSLTVGFLFHSVALYTSMRYGCFCAVFVLRRPFVCVELA